MNFLPSFAEAHHVIESCLFRNIPTPTRQTRFQNDFISDVEAWRLQGKYSSFAARQNQHDTRENKLSRESPTRQIVDQHSSCQPLSHIKQLLENNRRLWSLSFETYCQKDSQCYECTQSRPLFMLAIRDLLYPPAFTSLGWEVVSDNHFRLCHVFRSRGDNSARDRVSAKRRKVRNIKKAFE